ncbi:MAG: histidine kinase [Pseudomonadota bacterium]
MADTPASMVSAAELRQHIADLEAEKARLLAEKRKKADDAMKKVAEDFVHKSLSPDEIAELRGKIKHAVENGLMEVMVMRFPSRLCSDKGRAINNALEDWPETLPGKARELYKLWLERAKGQGFKLRAMIVDYPGGIPGDVGLFLNWSE